MHLAFYTPSPSSSRPCTMLYSINSLPVLLRSSVLGPFTLQRRLASVPSFPFVTVAVPAVRSVFARGSF